MDSQSITAVLNLYSAALDSHSWDLFDEIFAHDVEADYPGGLRWRDLRSFKREFARRHEATAGHQHFLGPPQILVEEDHAFALTYGRFNLFRKSPAIDPFDLSEGGAWYDDELVRTAEGWRVRRRTARIFWWRESRLEDGTAPHVVESFPEWVRSGRVAYMTALRRQVSQRHGPQAPAGGP